MIVMKKYFDFNAIKHIKTKLMVQNGLVIFLSFITFLMVIYSYVRIEKANAAGKSIQNLSSDMQGLQKLKAQLLRKDSTLVNPSEKINELVNGAMKETAELVQSSAIANMKYADSLKVISANLETYAKGMADLAEKTAALGNNTHGIDGEFKKLLANIDQISAPFDHEYVTGVQQISEEFELHKNLSAITAIDQILLEFKKSLNDRKDMENLLSQFQNTWTQKTKLEKEIGLNHLSGLQGELDAIYDKAEPLTERMNEQSKAYVQHVIESSLIWAIILFAAQFLIALSFSNRMANGITAPINKIREAMAYFSKGNLPQPIAVNGQDEVSEIANEFNNLLDRIKEATNFSETIGKGNLEIQYNEKFSNDALAVSLISMQNQLTEVHVENERRNWINEGLTSFNQIMRETEDPDLFYNRFLSKLIRYLSANQGYLYIVNDDVASDPVMELKAVYAYGKQRYLEEKLNIHYKQGLLGQAWFDREPLNYTEIPEDFVNITSGMGEAKPRNIFILPLLYNDVVYGAIELASFHPLQPHETELVKKIGETLAGSISGLKVNQKTVALLRQSQEQMEELKAQEEQSRQFMEEMNATQEEMSRREEELKKKTRELEEFLRLKNKA